MALNEEDHDLLTRIDERVERIDIRMNSHSESIKSLERFRSWVLGGKINDHFIGDERQCQYWG